MSYTFGSDSLTSGFKSDKEIEALFSLDADIAAMIDFESALTKALSDAGFIPSDHANTIIAHLTAFKPDMDVLRQGFHQDGVIPPSLVTQVRATLSDDVSSCFHFGVTSQDLVDSSAMIRLKQIVKLLTIRLNNIDQKLISLAENYSDDLVLQARTRMQNALPISVPEKIGNWRSQIGGMSSTAPQSFPIQMGGPEGAARKFGDQYSAVKNDVAKRLDLTATDHHWQTNRQPLISIAFWFSCVATAMGKIAQDVLMMVQSDVCEVVLQNGGSSSAMPHKRNPIRAELILAQTRYCHTQMSGLNTASIHENERSGTAWTLEWMLLPELVMMSGSATLNTLQMIDTLSFVTKDEVN